MLTLAYVALAVIGCGYVLAASFLGHMTDAGSHGHDAGGAETHYGVDGSGHGSAHASDAAGASFHFPFFSPLALATLGASVGAYGLIAKFGLRVGDETSLLMAIPAAVATAYAVTYASWRLVQSSRGTSAISLRDFKGAHAEVITPIPAGGLGEVAALVDNQRFTAPARAADGLALSRGAAVTVLEMVGTTLVVTAGRPGERGTTNG